MESNPVFEMAADFVNNTACNIFLTGKAGTGKTTFLKFIRENTKKKSVVVAPTGVAAINAGGVTMHSFFQLPFGPYVPVTSGHYTEGTTNKHTLFKNMRLSADKRDLIRELELLIIDEVSMVRSDMLDAMDAILRTLRRQPHKVFGGVQVLFIGDLFQLPPVMPDSEWLILKSHYQSPFFFSAKVLAQSQLVYLELKKIYRQNEQRFIQILNRIRNNEVEADDLKTLNSRYNTPLIPGKKYITLTSHNYKADRINQEALKNLPGKRYEYKGVIEGDFPEKTLPTEMTLQLKEGAQVMFIRNDKSENRRFFNGKIATVSRIDDDGVRVIMDEDGEELLVEKESWNNIRYTYNPDDEEIQEEILGSFSQYPIRLAWAITIHKSQGLTFEHAIVDAGDSFAPGQVYVALSRCVSLNGLVLHSKIDKESISTHEEVISFSRNEKQYDALETLLQEEKHVFTHSRLLDTFDFHGLVEIIEHHVRHLQSKKSPEVKEGRKVALALLKTMESFQYVAVKFRPQLEDLLREGNIESLRERVSKAIQYFTKGMTDELLNVIDIHAETLKGTKRIKKYLVSLSNLKLSISKKLLAVQNASLGTHHLNTSSERISLEESKTKTKPEKGASLKETQELVNSGHSVKEIASIRNLSVSTVEGHVVLLVKSGDISIDKIVSEPKLKSIITAIQEVEGPIGLIKARLGEDFSFGEIRAVMNYLQYQKTVS